MIDVSHRSILDCLITMKGTTVLQGVQKEDEEEEEMEGEDLYRSTKQGTKRRGLRKKEVEGDGEGVANDVDDEEYDENMMNIILMLFYNNDNKNVVSHYGE